MQTYTKLLFSSLLLLSFLNIKSQSSLECLSDFSDVVTPDVGFWGTGVLINDTLIIGGPKYKNNSGIAVGGVLVYKVDSVFTLIEEVFPSTANSGSRFGGVVIVDGNTMAVFAQHFQQVGNPHKSAVFIFKKSGNSWVETQIIYPTTQSFTRDMVIIDGHLFLQNEDNSISIFEPSNNGEFSFKSLFTPNYPAGDGSIHKVGNRLIFSAGQALNQAGSVVSYLAANGELTNGEEFFFPEDPTGRSRYFLSSNNETLIFRQVIMNIMNGEISESMMLKYDRDENGEYQYKELDIDPEKSDGIYWGDNLYDISYPFSTITEYTNLDGAIQSNELEVSYEGEPISAFTLIFSKNRIIIPGYRNQQISRPALFLFSDLMPPSVVCKDTLITPTNPPGPIVVTQELVTSSISDNCYAPEVSFEPSSIAMNASQPVTITVSVFDGLKTATCQSIVTVQGDVDMDGFNSDVDCDDNDPTINPDATEIVNNDIDEDCDGIAQMIDVDMDGFNSDEDCDDSNGDINPDAIEIPNNAIDEDCDGIALIIDADMDGFNSDEDCDDDNDLVNPDIIEVPYNGLDDDCNPLTLDDDLDMDGFINGDDCNDMNADINPDAVEIANNTIDEDCDGIALIIDVDMDGFNSDDDCDDDNAMVNPDAVEVPYNGLDDDCDPESLDDDLDMDGFNSEEDCDDDNAMINPDAVEVPYNGLDDDCDPESLDDDLDMDGFNLEDDCDDDNAMINPDVLEVPYNGLDDDCDPESLDDDLDMDGFNLEDDCNDDNANINPDAIEILNNGIDEDCDGIDGTSAVNDISSALISITPNPFNHSIIIKSESSIDRVRVFDALGRNILEEEAKNKTHSLQLLSLPSGSYIIQLFDANGVSVTRRIMKI